MEESRKITLGLGHISLEKNLGAYYIDMRPSLVHYTDNIYGGKFDASGVPMCRFDDELVYFPINIAQYGFILHADYLEKNDDGTLNKLKNCLSILESLKKEVNNQAIWWHNHFENKYRIDPPWASAMAQGEVISFYLRMYQILSDEDLLLTAKKAYNFLQVDVKDGGVRTTDLNGYLWFEEYPSNPSSYVLNGFIYTIFGLYDLFRVTGDQRVKRDIDQSIETLKLNVNKFDAGYWSYYDLLKSELVRYYYQKNVHVPQMEILYRLTGEDIFKRYQLKWRKNVTPINFLFVQLMYRILPRWLKLKKWIKSGFYI